MICTHFTPVVRGKTDQLLDDVQLRFEKMACRYISDHFINECQLIKIFQTVLGASSFLSFK